MSIPTSIVVVLLNMSTGISPSWTKSWKRSSYFSVLLHISSRWSLCESWAVCSSVSITWICLPFNASSLGFLQKLTDSNSSPDISCIFFDPQLGQHPFNKYGVISEHCSHLYHTWFRLSLGFIRDKSIYNFPFCAVSKNISFKTRFHIRASSDSSFHPIISFIFLENFHSVSSP